MVYFQPQGDDGGLGLKGVGFLNLLHIQKIRLEVRGAIAQLEDRITCIVVFIDSISGGRRYATLSSILIGWQVRIYHRNTVDLRNGSI